MSTDREAETPTPSLPARVFLNYASEDREWAVWLRAKLLEAGLADVWLDHTGIEGGDDWKREIDEGLCRSTALLALLTKGSVDPSRRWIQYERDEAKRLLKPVIPLRLEAEAGLPEEFERLHYVDFAGDREAALPGLLSAIRRYTLRYTSRAGLKGGPPPLRGAFVGREAELRAVFDMIDGPTARAETGRVCVAIQGMGGQGKTALAYELIRRIAVRYPGGLLIEQRGQVRAPAGEVLQTWVEKALGKKPERVYDAADVRSLLDEYGELLVLIDDVSESDFEETNRLLDALPADATRLVTTRSLNAGTELECAVFQLSGLSDEDARELVRERLRSRVRVTAAPEDSREEDEGQEAAIRRLVELVQGHALALKLAAARCKLPEDLPGVVDQLAAGMAEGLDDLKVGLARAPQKDNSLAVSLDISLKQLGEYDLYQGTNWVERFAALGVFPDGSRMNPGIISAVWGDAGEKDKRTGAALEGIYRLAMIEVESGNIYHSHPLLSAFARSLLREEPERSAAARIRYHDFLTRTAGRGFGEPEEHWSRMELYKPHLLHAAAGLWEECTLLLGNLDALALPEVPAGATLTDPPAQEAALRAVRFAQAFLPYVLRRPALGEVGRRLLTLGLASARASGSEELFDTFVRALGAWYARSKPPEAEHYFEQALRWAERTGDRAEQGKVLSEYGELQRNRSKLDGAIRLLDRALAIHEDLRDARMEAATHKSLGEAYWRRCDFDTALGHYNRARDIYRGLGDRSGEADLLNKIGSVEFNRGNYEKAVSYFQEALPMHQELENRSMEGEDLNDMGIAYNYLGRHDEALPLLKKAIEIHGQIGNRRLEAVAVSNLAGAFYALGRSDPREYEKAAREAEKAGAIARDIECKFTEVWALNWEALAQQELGRPELAQTLLERADELLDETGGPRERVATWGNLGYLLGKHLGQRERGAELLRRAIELMRDNRFERAFGGRTKADLEAMLQEIGG